MSRPYGFDGSRKYKVILYTKYQALAHYGLDRYASRLEGEECIVGAQIDHRKELFTAAARIPVGKGQIILSTLDLQGAIDEGKRPAVVARRILQNFLLN